MTRRLQGLDVVELLKHARHVDMQGTSRPSLLLFLAHQVVDAVNITTVMPFLSGARVAYGNAGELMASRVCRHGYLLLDVRPKRSIEEAA